MSAMARRLDVLSAERPARRYAAGRRCRCGQPLSVYNEGPTCNACDFALRAVEAEQAAPVLPSLAITDRMKRLAFERLMAAGAEWTQACDLLPGVDADTARRVVSRLRRMGLRIEGRKFGGGGYRIVRREEGDGGVATGV